MTPRAGIEVVVDGVIYPSIAAASRAIGVSYAKIYEALRGRPKPQTAKNTLNRDRRPVTIRGVTYPSVAAAAKAFGVTASYISHAIKRGSLNRVGVRRQK